MSGTNTELTGAQTKAWLLAYADRVIADADELTELDRQAGDGDFGWNISSALKRVRTGASQNFTRSSVSAVRVIDNPFMSNEVT